MKKEIMILIAPMTLTVLVVTVLVLTRKVELTKPEKGITCVKVKTLANDWVGAGCYTGNVHDNTNKINAAATKKYQSNI